ncbi:hypothetical protein BH11PSE2_BH11PSE2_18570 [soil metagenome]
MPGYPRPLVLLLSAALAAAPGSAPADSPALVEKRQDSCEGRAFAKTGADAAAVYTHKAFKLVGPTRVGDALLEWCQSATNAVIYFYVDDPMGPDHAKCPEAMSLAIFPGQGGETRSIIDDNVASYTNPQVKLISEPVTGPTTVTARGGRTIAAYQLEAEIEQAGLRLRKRMLGYDRGGDFIRVMSSYVDDPACSGGVVRGFLTALAWP